MAVAAVPHHGVVVVIEGCGSSLLSQRRRAGVTVVWEQENNLYAIMES